MLNHITVMGRLTRDPELRRTGSDIPVASFTVAVDRDRAPEGQEKETDFIDCVAWRNTGEFVSKYFTKGRMIVVSGRLQIRNWTDKDGNKRRSAEIVADNCYFGDSKKDDQQSQGGGNYQQTANTNYNQNSYPGSTGGAPRGYSPQGYGQPNYGQPYGQGYGQPYQQQGFGGYQQNFPPIEGDDPNLPF